MKKIILIVLGLVTGFSNYAQDNVKPDFSSEINQQVWEPFKKAYSSRDAALYLSIHSEDIIRVTKDGIRQGEEFRENIIKWYKKSNNHYAIEFKFEHRIHGEDIAYEVGYYKSTFKPEKGDTRISIGRFHVVLKKISGDWKIAQDWDTDVINGYVITEADFDKL